MTYDGGGGDEGGVPELRLSLVDAGGDYLKLPQCDGSVPPIGVPVMTMVDDDGELTVLVEPSTPKIRCRFLRKWVKMVLLFLFIAVLAVVFIKWIGPFVMEKVSSSSPYPFFGAVCFQYKKISFVLVSFCFCGVFLGISVR